MNRIKEMRKKKRMTQAELARVMSVAQNTISTWETETIQIDNESLKRMAEFFAVTTDYLLGMCNQIEVGERERNAYRIPVLGCIQAGIPMEAIEEILDWEEIPESMARSGEYFGLQIRGDSMEPKMSEDDVVIVRKQEKATSGDVAIVIVNGDEATVKRVLINDSGITLVAFNPTYSPVHYTPEQVEALPVRILGKVVELRAKYK